MSEPTNDALQSILNSVSQLGSVVSTHTEAIQVIATTLASIQQQIRALQEPTR